MSTLLTRWFLHSSLACCRASLGTLLGFLQGSSLAIFLLAFGAFLFAFPGNHINLLMIDFSDYSSPQYLMYILIDVKFVLGIKNINFCFFTHTPICVALYTQYFPESCEKRNITGIFTRVGFKPMTLAILEQCLTN